MGLHFGGEEGEQMTIEQLLAQKAKEAARDELSTALQEDRGDDRIDRAKRAAMEHTDELRDELGSLTKLTPLERYTLIALARALVAAGKTKKGIKRRINRLLE